MNTAPVKTKKQLTHDRIVDVAARAVRQRGYDGVGVAEIMREAGLTHGGFYAHFPSREALLVEAVERAGMGTSAYVARRRAAAAEQGISPFRSLVETYLADVQLKPVEGGCAVAALVAEMPRQSDDVRRVSVGRVQSFVKYVAKVLPAHVDADEAPMIAGTLVGTLQIARAIGSPEKGKAMLARARETLLAQYDPS
jgi:TetR/AcrR family transcriptional regulator, transcriptional repressor for nem operon